MVNINNWYVYWLSFLYIVLWLILKVNVDNVIVMWIVYGEMMNWKWMLMNCLELDWIVFVIEKDELKFGILSYVLNKEWFELLWLWIEIVDMEWNDEFVNCLCFDGNWVRKYYMHLLIEVIVNWCVNVCIDWLRKLSIGRRSWEVTWNF